MSLVVVDGLPRRLRLTLPEGYAKTIRWHFWTDDTRTTPADLSAWSAWQFVITTPGQSDVVIDGTAASGIVTTVLPDTLVAYPRTPSAYVLRATDGVPVPIIGGVFELTDDSSDGSVTGETIDVHLATVEDVHVIGLGASSGGGGGGGGGAVSSVQGRTGAVVITATDVGLGTEAADRAAGDSTNATAISAEATARANGDSTNATAISTEATARANADALLIPLTQRGANSGVATLDGGGKIPQSQLPAVAIVNYLGSVANQSAMLALVGQEGDWCIRSDLSAVFVVTAQPSSVLGNWQELGYPTGGGVSSVAGRTGTVVLTSADLTDFTEAVQDVVGALIAAGTGIVATYNDAGNVETLAVDTSVIATRAYADAAVATETTNRTNAVSAEATARANADALLVAKASNGSDFASAPSTRYNLHDQVLAACKAVATANVASLSGTTTIDGIALADGDLVLLTAQTTGSQNGPQVVHAGVWTRPNDYPTGGSVISRIVEVQQGTAYAGTLWESYGASGTAVIDTDPTTWAITNRAYFDGRYGASSSIGSLASRPAANSVLAGTLYSSNDTFELFRSNGTTWDKIADIGSLPRYGRVTTAGHSYTQTAGTKQAFPVGIGTHGNFSHRVAAFLNVSAEECFILGKSGGQANTANAGDTAGEQQGTGMIYRFIQPSHRLEPFVAATTYATSKAWPGVFVLMYGVNDPVRPGVVSNSPVNQALVASTNGMRAMISRLMMSQLYGIANTPGTLAFSGFGSTIADTGFTDGQYRKSQSNGDTFTCTLPPDFKGGTAVVGLVGGTGITVLTSAITNVATTLTLTDPFGNGQHTQIQTGDVIRVDSEDMTVTGGAGTLSLTVTRGVNGTSAVSHGSSTGYLTAATAKVNWSGSATGATGSTVTAGQGCASGTVRSLIPVVKRFALTAADAGKTIVGTVAGLVGSNEFVGVDAFWIEDPDPNTVLLVNQPFGCNTFFVRSNGAAYNAMLATVAAEFTAGNVAVVDVNTPFDALYNGNLKNAVTSARATSAIFNPLTPAGNVMANGTILRVGGTTPPAWVSGTSYLLTDVVSSLGLNYKCILATSGTTAPAGDPTHWTAYTIGVEEALVTVVSKVGSDWTATLTRGVNGTQPQAWAAGVEVNDVTWLSADRIHPSDDGHVRIAAQCIATLLLTAQTTRQKANAGGLVLRRRPRIQNGSYLPGNPPGGKSTQAAPVIGDAVAYPIEVPEMVLALSLNAEVTTLAASGAARVALYTDGGGYPGQKIAEATFATTTTGEKVGTFTPPPLLMPGFYWLVYLTEGSGGAATMRTATGAPFTPQYPWQWITAGAQASPFNATTTVQMGLTWSPGAGTLPASYAAPPTGASMKPTNIPMLELVVSVPVRDT